MSTLSQNERQALNDIFTAITEKETFFSKLKENKSNEPLANSIPTK